MTQSVHDYKNRIECVRQYHQQTKHRFERYAKGPQTLDWSMQPNPFRRFEGSAAIPLPLLAHATDVPYGDLYDSSKRAPRKFRLSSIGTLLELSMGLSAWKEYQGDRWALRCNPSSGNLHPTETYVVATGIRDLDDGVYHYLSYDHVLEQRCAYAEDDVAESHRAAGGDKVIAEPVLIIGFSSITWREAWKYGERAFRYCQLDVGHAMAAIRYACAVNGWSAELISNTTDSGVAKLLGLDRDQDFDNAEREHAELLLKISTTSSSTGFIDFDNLRSRSLTGQWYGRANILDKHHLYHWPIIEEVARATEVDTPLTCAAWVPEAIGAPAPCETTLMADEIIHRRRSAQMYDGQTGIEAPQLFRILDMLIPRPNIPPWDVIPWQPKIHLVLFVHRVNGLAPGLYIMPRNRQALQNLKNAMLDTLEWLPMESTPRHLDLYRLVKANAQKAAASLTCHQRIASDSAFSLGMLSEFDAALLNGPWAYKRLYWEAGLLGQVLYLEAEAINLQGTGIGCFFDDPFHEMLGLKDSRFQCLYHFTMGGALNDSRLRTLMPYEHLKRD